MFDNDSKGLIAIKKKDTGGFSYSKIQSCSNTSSKVEEYDFDDTNEEGNNIRFLMQGNRMGYIDRKYLQNAKFYDNYDSASKGENSIEVNFDYFGDDKLGNGIGKGNLEFQVVDDKGTVLITENGTPLAWTRIQDISASLGSSKKPNTSGSNISGSTKPSGSSTSGGEQSGNISKDYETAKSNYYDVADKTANTFNNQLNDIYNKVINNRNTFCNKFRRTVFYA